MSDTQHERPWTVLLVLSIAQFMVVLDVTVVNVAVPSIGDALHFTPAALSIVAATYTGEQRKTALTTWGAIASGGAAAGMMFGGMLTSWASWEWVFLINVPIGAALAVVTLHRIEPTPRPPAGERHFDIPGALLALAGLVTLVYGLEG